MVASSAILIALNAVGIASAFSQHQPHPLDKLATLSASTDVPPVPIPAWYSDSSLLRDRGHVIPADGGFDYRPINQDSDDGDNGDGGDGLSPTMLEVLRRSTSRIIPFSGSDVYVHRLEGGAVEPLFLSYDDCDPNWLGNDKDTTISWLGQQSLDEGDDGREETITEEQKMDYFAIDIPHSSLDQWSTVLVADGIESSPVRNYGDSMSSRTHAALLASANGLLSFHRTHKFCSKCGSPTGQMKAGSARKCTDESCRTSVYPRIDPAVIMLITSPCGEYALLGRNKRWPSGRYSTLAGFAEVGETLEECVVRETLEEAGVAVDPASMRFVASQPWPFPRSMMVGFMGKAATVDSNLIDDDAAIRDGDEAGELPNICVDPAELEDALWFSKDYVRVNGLVEGRGSSALDFDPDEKEAEFHVPGPASLARLLITKWVTSGAGN
mmetsp:Transcript_29461/g.55770  ORF Transcript_29461/g.55770 Transcript_29461/m.55770 type:complete len:440 (-) Transcript_29461:1900-3219(-)|eukprot:CAMPEP_0201665906 /NCGR_PEP_ID=MMETSP0494-20130426/6904_1 /ASSEMBLY_ACC=CAM_ASM_000839 /TAXON_ID=420259 /ORGANISM="Thalassiosira gravida, Strain GMp14c1" /LENGTH=439 /DNA_ID=CAMNT_0048144945 /DNA_START=268 /DNA_END=1587 /DNA_ORIENTATION=+